MGHVRPGIKEAQASPRGYLGVVLGPPSARGGEEGGYQRAAMNSSSSSSMGGEGRHDDDSGLTEFLSSLMDYTPTIPDELTEHYLGKSGFHCPDLRLLVPSPLFLISRINLGLFGKKREKKKREERERYLLFLGSSRDPSLASDPSPVGFLLRSGRRGEKREGNSPRRNEATPLLYVFFVRTRLVSVATQKFMLEVANDALQHCKARQAAPVKDKSKQPKEKRLVLTMDDLSKSLQEVSKYFISVTELFVDDRK
ncbi:hypothetical protein B296_00003328 [Ensete ventricosum]|uniref:Uncharacterized protein n=1 Tax=Ensete ventricosum TaxID=4639 RepID=A0A427AGA9_ENSVE|nr:hypothetical protein B296_00003328 [Ensete ventricosum]